MSLFNSTIFSRPLSPNHAERHARQLHAGGVGDADRAVLVSIVPQLMCDPGAVVPRGLDRGENLALVVPMGPPLPGDMKEKPHQDRGGHG
jgi:hypothetical protein